MPSAGQGPTPGDRFLQASLARVIGGPADTCVSPLAPGDCRMPGEARPNSDTETPASLTPDLSRRGFVATASAAAASGFALAQGSARAAVVRTDIAGLP